MSPFARVDRRCRGCTRWLRYLCLFVLVCSSDFETRDLALFSIVFVCSSDSATRGQYAVMSPDVDGLLSHISLASRVALVWSFDSRGARCMDSNVEGCGRLSRLLPTLISRCSCIRSSFVVVGSCQLWCWLDVKDERSTRQCWKDVTIAGFVGIGFLWWVRDAGRAR